MENIFKKLNKEKKLGLFALALGFFAIFGGTPNNNVKVTINAKELSLLTETQIDKVKPEELADWIIQGKVDYRLIDIRSPKAYKEYHIPVAENISSADLYKTTFLPTEKIIVCGNDGFQTAQGWFILKSKNYKSVYILDGGIKGWENNILFPKIPESETKEQKAQFDKIIQVSEFFGGSPQMGGNNNAENKKIELPKIKLPSFNQNTTQKKHKREGC